MPDFTLEEGGCRLEVTFKTQTVKVLCGDEKVGSANGPEALEQARKMVAAKDEILAARREWKERKDEEARRARKEK